MEQNNDNSPVSEIVAFINEIGLQCKVGQLPDGTFLPGVQVQDGCIIFDPEKLKYPGDLIHEAGHLAVLLPQDRLKATPGNMNGDIDAAAAEMSAISWSWAAIMYLGIPPEVLFHEYGYAGGSSSLIENFRTGRYLAVPMLQYLNMTTEPKAGIASDENTYPKMKHWLPQPIL